MSVEAIAEMAQDFAERHGIDIQIPSVLTSFDLDDIEYTFGVYGEEDMGEEIVNRYVHAELQAA